jgi:hypothetical protein
MRHALLLLLIPLLLPLGGCDAETCEGACHQYYSADACNQVPDGNRSQEQAELDCVQDCSEALNKSADEASNNGRVRNGGNEHDAIQFIRCVNLQDYSDAAFNDTCVNKLKIPCGFTW